AASTMACATSRSMPGTLTFRRARRKYAPSALFRSTSASIAVSAGSLILRLPAATAIAPSKQADQPAAKSCSGLVPVPGAPGLDSLTSRRPSLLREAPSRPPVVCVLAVYRSFAFVVMLVAMMILLDGWACGQKFRSRSHAADAAGVLLPL